MDCQRQLRRVSGGKPALLLWALSSSLTLTSNVANVRARYRRADSGDGQLNAARAGDADPLSGGRRQCRYDDLWLDDRSASYPASLRDRGVVLRRWRRHFAGQ